MASKTGGPKKMTPAGSTKIGSPAMEVLSPPPSWEKEKENATPIAHWCSRPLPFSFLLLLFLFFFFRRLRRLSHPHTESNFLFSTTSQKVTGSILLENPSPSVGRVGVEGHRSSARLSRDSWGFFWIQAPPLFLLLSWWWWWWAQQQQPPPHRDPERSTVHAPPFVLLRLRHLVLVLVLVLLLLLPYIRYHWLLRCGLNTSVGVSPKDFSSTPPYRHRHHHEKAEKREWTKTISTWW